MCPCWRLASRVLWVGFVCVSLLATCWSSLVGEFVCVSLLATCCLVGGVCVCVPSGDLPVESCRWGLCVCPCW